MFNSSIEETETRTRHPELVRTGLWKIGTDGEVEAVTYPKANFVTAPTAEGMDLRLIVSDTPDLAKMKINFKGSSGREEMFPDYVIRPHLYVPNKELWLTDGHRYLPTVLKTAEEMGKPVEKVLSVDLDYFGRLPEAKMRDEARKLIATAYEAAAHGAIVIPDAHEDDFEARSLNPNGASLGKVVEMTDTGQILDENFIPMLGRQVVIIKPPLSEYALTMRDKPGVKIILPDGSLKIPTGSRFDLVHMCTSPGYMQPQKAIAALRIMTEELYGNEALDKR